MSSQTIAISNLDNTLITWGFEVSETLLNMWLFFRIISIILELIGIFIFHQVQNFQVWFRLWKTRWSQVTRIDIVNIFDIVFNSLQIEWSCNLVCCNDNAILLSMNKVSHKIRFDISKSTIYVSDICIWRSHEFDFIIVIHRNDNLFSWRILSCHLYLLLLIILWIFSIFLANKLGKFSLSFNISLTFGTDAWAYNCLVLGLVIFFVVLSFLKNLDFSKTSLGSLTMIGEGILTTSNCFFFNCSFFLTGLMMLLFEVNLEKIFYLNVLLFLLVSNIFHSTS